jgi:hypothetical protein
MIVSLDKLKVFSTSSKNSFLILKLYVPGLVKISFGVNGKSGQTEHMIPE